MVKNFKTMILRIVFYFFMTFDKKWGMYRYPPPLSGFRASGYFISTIFSLPTLFSVRIFMEVQKSIIPSGALLILELKWRVSVQMLSPIDTWLTKIKTYLIEYQISTFIWHTQSLLPQLPIGNITITATTGGGVLFSSNTLAVVVSRIMHFLVTKRPI